MIARVVAIIVLALVVPSQTQAVPAFAQQTGQPCTTCHIGSFGPQLTPFGREFKIEGYTITGGEGLASKIPLSAMLLGSFTNTGSSQPAGAAPHFATNNNFALDQVSIFFAGRITDFAGAFVQGTYSGVDKAFLLDNIDLKLTTPLSIGDTEVRIGATVNNGPTVQDPFNSTPVWIFPFASWPSHLRQPHRPYLAVVNWLAIHSVSLPTRGMTASYISRPVDMGHMDLLY
jgi:hypothetical protein